MQSLISIKQMNNKNIIIFSSIDWSTHTQLHQQLTNSLALENNNILYIENTGVRRLKLIDFKRVILKIKSWLSTTGGYKESSKLITILITVIFPFPYSRFFNFINSNILYFKIKKWQKYNQNKTIIITFLPTPLIHKIIDKIDHELLIYYCANHMSKGSKQAHPLKLWEELMFKKSDYVVSISDEITNRASKFNEKVFKVSPGVDKLFFKFKKERSLVEYINIKKPIVGYVGAISNVIDFELIKYLIDELHDYSFVFIGPVYESKKFNEIINDKKVFYLGEKKHDTLPDYISYFDIAIVPYKVNEFTNSVYSCKLNEYLACGKTVISTPIAEHKKFSSENQNTIFISDNFKKFKEDIIANTKNINSEIIKNRINLAKKNSWIERFKYFNHILDENYNLKSKNKKNKNKTFINFYKKSRSYFYKFVLSSIILFLLIFYSPFFHLVGNALNDYKIIEKSDAIVVYSGNDARFSEQSYLSRTLEAKNAFNKGYAKSIILISGKEQKIKEVKIMQSYLIDSGLPLENIYIFNNYPSSTYSGIEMIASYLKKNNYKKIIYLSSNFHNKRSKLIWKKNFPQFEIITPNLKEKNKKFFYWSSNLSEIKLIIYEIAALIHNKLFNRL